MSAARTIAILVLLIESLVVLTVVAASLLTDMGVCRSARFDLAGESLCTGGFLSVLRIAAIDGCGVHVLIIIALDPCEAVIGSELVPSTKASCAKFEACVVFGGLPLLEVALAHGEITRNIGIGAETGGAVLALSLCLVQHDVVDVEVSDIAHVERHDVVVALSSVLV